MRKKKVETKYITATVRRLETPEERTERESREVAVRAVAAAIIALCVAAIFLAWFAIFSNRAIIEQTKRLTEETKPLAANAARVDYLAEVRNVPDSVKGPAEPSQSEPNEPSLNNTPLTDEEYAALLEVCEECRVAPSLALGLIEAESGFNPNAIAASGSGCYGYCQISPVWHPANLNPIENIQYGVRYLASLCEKYDSTEAGLTAHNAGYDTGYRGYANAVLEAAEKWEEKLNGR